MTNKEKYREFCKTEKGLIIFSKDWWLDAVCGEDNWDVALVEKDGMGIVAALPYFKRKHYIFDLLLMPSATQNLGPYIKYPINQGYYKKFSWEKDLIYALIGQLPKYTVFHQRFPYTLTNVLPFLWKGFNIGIEYTYVIENIDLKVLEKEFETDTNRRRRRSENAGVQIIQTNEFNKLYSIISETFTRKNMNTSYTSQFVERIFKAASLHNSCRLSFAVYKEKYVATSFLVYDDISVYYLMGGIISEDKNLGSMSMLLHENIKFALDSGKKFDFEGGGIEATNKFFRSFGAKEKVYFTAERINSKIYKVLKFIKSDF